MAHHPGAHTAAAPVPYGDGRLLARPGDPPSRAPLPAGARTLVFPGGREALFHAPASQPGQRPPPLLLLLHGIGGQHGGADAIALAYAARLGAVLLAPRSLADSWDVIRGGYGPDLAFIDSLLRWTFQRHAVDSDALSIAGFSDGASYALSLGLMNGELFSDIVAFSPGFARPLRRQGRPRIFIAHGQADAMLPVERGRAIARQLMDEGYQVRYQEFDGAHTVPPPIAGDALLRVLVKE